MENCTDLVVFSHASPFTDLLKAEKRLFTFFGKDICMTQKWACGGRGGTDIGFGASVYNSSIVLAYYVEAISEQVGDAILMYDAQVITVTDYRKGVS